MAPVIDENDFISLSQALHHLGQSLIECWQDFGLVVDRNDYGEASRHRVSPSKSGHTQERGEGGLKGHQNALHGTECWITYGKLARGHLLALHRARRLPV
jgi:hypothetical protein